MEATVPTTHRTPPIRLHPLLQESMLLSCLSDSSSPLSSSPATSPPQKQLWLVVLSHVIYLQADSKTPTDLKIEGPKKEDGEKAVSVKQVQDAMINFWTSNVPITWEGYGACRRRAKKLILKRDGKQAAADVEAQGEKWQFSWWDSLEPGRKVEKALKKTEVDDKEEVQGKWMEPRVDSEGNIRLVLGGLEV